ncbi:MAG: glycerol-3-phosphate 1-O-acyltransferase PlsY [Candidatus Margulisiibacteriota bacterium]
MLIFILSYLIGSIPFGLLIGKLKGIDIRQHGSGNIGATNVFRTLGPRLGTLVFILDLLKGAVPVWIALSLTPQHWPVIAAGAAAIIGHSFPIFLKFKGGKGVATGLGVLLAIAPDIFAVALVSAIIVIFISRYVSVGSMFTAVLIALLFWFWHKPLSYCLAVTLLTGLVLLRHVPNIKRLQHGTEPKIGARK